MTQRLWNLFCSPPLIILGGKSGANTSDKKKNLWSGLYRVFTSPLSITDNAPTRFTPHIKHQSGVRVWAPKPKNKTFAIDWLLIYSMSAIRYRVMVVNMNLHAAAFAIWCYNASHRYLPVSKTSSLNYWVTEGGLWREKRGSYPYV